MLDASLLALSASLANLLEINTKKELILEGNKVENNKTEENWQAFYIILFLLVILGGFTIYFTYYN